MTTETVKLSSKDFKSNQDVRWCPGCGDYSILAVMQRVLPEFDTPKEKYVFVSGIGCSSRFPYYMETYGFHTIHGRAPTIATGVKLANPELDVWMITGDGDSMSIGGNHFIHAARRNVNINAVIFNNRIYGLTKGQYSPTSDIGTKTKSTPMGSVDHPFNPAALAIGAGVTFYARTTDKDTKHMAEMFRRAHAHKGFSVVEVLQNCHVFNDGVHKKYTDKNSRDDNSIRIEHGQPLIFGKDKDKAICLNGFLPEVVNVADVEESELVLHDENDLTWANILSRFSFDLDIPMPLGVFLRKEKTTYDDGVSAQVELAKEKKGPVDLKALLYAGDTWIVD